MGTYTVLPEDDSNLDITITESDDLITLDIQPAALTIVGAFGVSSVNGLSGDVNLDSGLIPEGTNLYYTDARADARVDAVTGANLDLSFADTDELAEGPTNLYYTDARVDAKIANIDFPVDSVNGLTGDVVLDTDDIAEGTANLYYTDGRVQSVIDTNSAGFVTPVEVDVAIAVSAASTLNSANAYTDSAISDIEIPDNNSQLINGAGYITDYTVTQSDVTAHQSALSITESQISDLTHYTSSDFDTDFLTKSANDLSYDNTDSSLISTNVKAALDELDVKKVNVADMAATLRLYATNTSSGVTTNFGTPYLQVSSIDDTEYNDTPVNVATPEVTADDQVVGAVISREGILNGNPGNINISVIGNIRKTSGGTNHNCSFYFEVYHRASNGTETIMGTSNITSTINNTDYEEFFADCLLTTPVSFTSGDRVLIVYRATGVSGSPEYEFQFGGLSPVRANLPVQASIVAANQDASEVPVDTTNFDGTLSGADTTVQSALDTLDDLTIPTQYTDALAISALENNADTVLQGNLTVEGDFVVFNQVKIKNFEFPLVDYGFSNSWTDNTATIDMTAAYVNISIDSSDPTLIFDTSGYLDETNVRNVILQIDYRSGNGNINFPSNVFWDGLDKPNFGGNSYNRTIVRLVGRASGWVAKQDVVFNPVPGNPFGSTKTSLSAYRLTDIGEITDGSAGQVLSTNADGTFSFIDAGAGGGASELNDLSDVEVVSPADGDILRYNGVSSTFQNTNLGLSLTPTLSALSPQYGVEQSVTIDNYSSYQDPNVWAEVRDSTDSLVRSNEFTFDNHDGTVSWNTAGLAEGDYTVSVKVQDFGDLASDTANITVTKTNPNFRYWRVLLTGCGSYNILDEVRFFTDAGQTGTAYPPTMTANNAPAPYVISSSHEYTGYAAWEAFDAGSGVGSGWWNLAQPGGYEPAWIAVDMGTPQILTSYTVRWPGASYKNATTITIQGSNTGAWAGEETNIISTPVTPNLLYNIG